VHAVFLQYWAWSAAFRIIDHLGFTPFDTDLFSFVCIDNFDRDRLLYDGAAFFL